MKRSIELPRYEECFVCGDPARNPQSLKLRSYLEDGQVKAHFIPQAQHTGYPGIIHGGILVSLLDEVSIWAASIAADCFCVSRDLKVKFLKPARPGEALELTAKVIERDRLLTVEAVIESAQRGVIARSVGRFFPAFKDEWERRVKLDP